MAEGLQMIVNGRERSFEELPKGASLQQVMDALDLKADRVAVEHNGEIAPRANWSSIPVASGDKLEVVHFVGGGASTGVDRAPSS